MCEVGSLFSVTLTNKTDMEDIKEENVQHTR